MLKKRIEFHNINGNKSFSLSNEKRNSNISNIKLKYNNQISPKNKPLIDSKSQTNIFSLKKNIKISLNKFHQYLKNIGASKKNEINKASQLSPNIKNKNPKNNFINNNRNEIQNHYSFLTKYKTFYNKNSSNSNSEINKTTLLNNNNYNMNLRTKKLNRLNLGINCQSTKNSSFLNNYQSDINDDTSIFSKIQNINSTTYKNIAPFTLKKLKNSKFFYRTKYVTGPKNKNFKTSKNPSFSTYNISFNQEDKSEEIYNAINELIKNQILGKMNIRESNELNLANIGQSLNINKKSLIKDKISNLEKSKYFNILPAILNHVNKKQTMDDIYGEYNLYLSNITRSSLNANNATKDDNNIEKNKYPKIKYLFLENVINSLKHAVKFVNVKNNEEFEENVINVIRDEYNKIIERNSDIENIQDFLTYGYEYIPRHNYNSINKLPILKDTGLQTSQVLFKKNIYNKLNIYEHKQEKKPLIKENKTSERISDMKNFYLNQGYKSNKRIFGRTEIKTRNSFNKNENEKGLNHYRSSSNINENKNAKDSLHIRTPINNKEKRKYNKPKTKLIKINLKKDKSDKSIENKTPKVNYGNEDIKENINDINNSLNDIDNYINKKPNEIKFNNNKDINIDILKKYEKGKDISNELDDGKEINKKIEEEDKSSEISEKKEETLSDNKNEKDENMENDEEKKEEIEDLEKAKEEEEERKKNLKRKKYLRHKKIMKNNLLKSQNDALIALNEIEKSTKKSLRRNSLFIEFMNNNSNTDEGTEEKKIQNEKKEDEKEEKKEEDIKQQIKEEKEEKNNLEDMEQYDQEITVSSIDYSSGSDLDDFIKIKQAILPKTKKKTFKEIKKISYRRRDATANPKDRALKEVMKIYQVEELNNKMKKIYDNIYNKKKKKEENKNRKKKNYMFSFNGINLENFGLIQTRIKVNLNRLKEEIKYKITQGKYHIIELYNYDNFAKAIMEINFNKYKNDTKKLAERVHAMEKYFQLFYNELINRERQNNDEKRINRFLNNLKEEVGETIPFVINYKGKFCRASDLNKEGDLSKLNSPTNNI